MERDKFKKEPGPRRHCCHFIFVVVVDAVDVDVNVDVVVDCRRGRLSSFLFVVVSYRRRQLSSRSSSMIVVAFDARRQ